MDTQVVLVVVVVVLWTAVGIAAGWRLRERRTAESDERRP
jgi:hypothetical protein